MEFDVYDPSYSISGGYWQLGTARDPRENALWRRIADSINQVLPLDRKDLFHTASPNREQELWGAMRADQDFWAYRVYLTGRDQLGRPGRYFFALFRVQKLEELSTSRINRILTYLDDQTGIPLDLAPLREPARVEPSTPAVGADRFDSSPHPNQGVAFVTKQVASLSKGVHLAWLLQSGLPIEAYTGSPVSVGAQSTPATAPCIETRLGRDPSSGERNSIDRSALTGRSSHPNRATSPASADGAGNDFVNLLSRDWRLLLGLTISLILVVILAVVYFRKHPFRWESKQGRKENLSPSDSPTSGRSGALEVATPSPQLPLIPPSDTAPPPSPVERNEKAVTPLAPP